MPARSPPALAFAAALVVATTLVVVAAAAAPPAHALSDLQIDLVGARLAQGALRSWELGTRSQSILELNATTYSVFSHTTLPPPSTISQLADALVPFFDIPRAIVQNRSISNHGAQGPQPLIQDGSAGDPASIGMSVLLANWTGQDKGAVDYAGAAKDQLDFLLNVVPRTSDGAISHRVAEVQLWSDSVYMVPPFLAYYGAITQNMTLLVEAYHQISLYRSYLLDQNVSMWKHILLGTSGIDDRHWSTGNGWAAAGMLRVLLTIRHSKFANAMKSQQSDLVNWIVEIHTGIFPQLDASTNLFANYAGNPVTAPGNFFDASSTALLASTVYRLALAEPIYKHLPMAERIRTTLFSSNSSSSSSSPFADAAHFSEDGWLTPVVDPDMYGIEGAESPESEAFVVQLQAAWRDWQAAGSVGANGALLVRRGWGSGGGLGLVVGVLMLVL